MADPHATVAELESWVRGVDTVDPLPEDDDAKVRLLARASDVIDRHVTASYPLDEQTQRAADANTAQYLADATCAQVEFWLEVGEETDTAGPLQALQAGGLNIMVGAGGNRTIPLTIAPRAIRILQLAGLAGQPEAA